MARAVERRRPCLLEVRIFKAAITSQNRSSSACVRIPTKPATHSDLKAAGVPI